VWYIGMMSYVVLLHRPDVLPPCLSSSTRCHSVQRRSATASLAPDESCKLAFLEVWCLLDPIWLLFGMDTITGTGKVKTVSYWTQRRKIRAAVDEFFNDRENQDGPENIEAFALKYFSNSNLNLLTYTKVGRC